MTEEKNLSETMLNVRQSYRFLGAFNESLNDIIRIVQDEFAGLTYYHWTPKYNLLTRRTDPSKKWVWDALPYYNFSLLYLPEGVESGPSKGDWMLEVFVQLDCGFEEQIGSGAPDANSFSPVEQATSMMFLVAWRCEHVSGETQSWQRTWQQDLEYTDSNTKQVQEPNIGQVFSSVEIGEDFENLGDEQKIRSFAQRAKELFKSELGLALE